MSHYPPWLYIENWWRNRCAYRKFVREHPAFRQWLKDQSAIRRSK